MATVLMRWLERTPAGYERGMRVLTLGRLDRARERILSELEKALDADRAPAQPPEHSPQRARVLVVGSGTGVLATAIAGRGHDVVAIDTDPRMVATTAARIAAAGLESRAKAEHLDARDLPPRMAGAFDVVVAVLVLSEAPSAERARLITEMCGALRPGGRLLLADEVEPRRRVARALYRAVRGPLAAATWLLTTASTSPVHIDDDLEDARLGRPDLVARRSAEYLGGTLAVFELLVVPPRHVSAPPGSSQTSSDRAQTAPDRWLTAPDDGSQTAPDGRQTAPDVDSQTASARAAAPRLEHAVGLAATLRDAHALLFRILPPYPAVATGLRRVGAPTRSSPVLVTGNYELTVRRLAEEIEGRLDAWVLVVDSGGVNVWCAAGSGRLTAFDVLDSVRRSGLAERIDHRELTLPQLAATGVDGNELRAGGWVPRWGPVRAADIPAYLAGGGAKTELMRRVRFPLRDRLEMATATLGLYAPLVLLPAWLIWRHAFWAIAAALIALTYTYAVLLPFLPGRDGLAKSVPLSILGLAALGLVELWRGEPTLGAAFGPALGMVALAVFVAGEMQGMSPHMRGEQANWIVEAVVLALLLAAYVAVPTAVWH